MEFLKALLFGILEGITEWLPVSSTGHIILFERFVSLDVGGDLATGFAEEFRALFEVAIQLGAIGAVAVRYYDRLCPFVRGKTPLERRNTLRLYLKLVCSGLPAAAVGLFGDGLLRHFTGKDIDGWLYNGTTVAVMLILYGIFFLIPEKRLPRLGAPVLRIDDMGFGRAFAIGCFQALSIIPGTSRSGATILGGMMLGLPRPLAAEYSFLLAVPTMAGASLIKAAEFVAYVTEWQIAVPADAYTVLLIGIVSSFAVSMLAVDFLMDFVKKHTFRPFGIYRILLGAAVLLLSA